MAGFDPTSSSHGQTPEVDPKSRTSPMGPRPKMRKTQQRGPSNQRYDALWTEPKDQTAFSSVSATSGEANLELMDRLGGPENSTDSPGRVATDPSTKPHLQRPIISKV
jgi:hypothetical protein